MAKQHPTVSNAMRMVAQSAGLSREGWAGFDAAFGSGIGAGLARDSSRSFSRVDPPSLMIESYPCLSGPANVVIC
jgi:hypothetical protein